MKSRLLVPLSALLVLACALHACDGGGTTGSSGTTGTGGAGGEGGACPTGPQAMFTLTITADGGPVPSDTRVLVSWSAGHEPEFVLGKKESWKTLDTANLVCDVDHQGPPPTELPALVCHLWTNGATKVVVEASGYTTFEQTFVPTFSEHCNGPIPTPIEVKLDRDEDAGP